MTERRSHDRHGRRYSDLPGWAEQHARALAWMVVLLFVVLAVMAVGIASTANQAGDAAAGQRVGERERAELLRQVKALRRQNGRLAEQDELLRQEVSALRGQIEALGVTPVTVPPRSGSGGSSGAQPTPTTTTQPPTTTTSTPPTTTPCRVAVASGCLLR